VARPRSWQALDTSFALFAIGYFRVSFIVVSSMGTQHKDGKMLDQLHTLALYVFGYGLLAPFALI
jgi:hypothetical protein